MTSGLIDRQTIAAGSFVFREGEPANCAYIVQSGEIEIVKQADQDFVVIATIPAGGIFGEMALIDDAPRMAGARMGVGGTLIVVNRNTFETKMAGCDPFVRTLLKIFVDTIRRLQSGDK
ncbi:MAG: cyclic nucleotide-binding domain-containing protein [Rhodospirillales bacterium]|jgi:CRP/FNR family transcriptional regulator, cyclic AMP receptor protein|nr:cyclic nucleotide-binding domain-containing protein [Rhodospirillales bacterium]MBT4038657.1 cyclic nucleotide-binding domain-containing protein [Rhodospirillales bacterium]MBT4628517.1 cyclic nucleotide-binding domain-containing protein [Rhodospirillales bacterium]MBT5350446.1 cyclic nucleotide-binding domain-containing protein [Rhodospirillales bacterium]MBT5520334.1 cyclic nucleotide-binding domain-containing protein [Rhodospirillales bacterium]